MMSLTDPVEQRDPWRTAWQVVTGDALFVVVCALALVGLLAGVLLPQAPSAGTANPVAYSQWEALARLREGSLYEPFATLGLNSIAQTAWWRIALAVLGVLAILRLMDRVGQFLAARTQRVVVNDEPRVRVTQNAPSVGALAERLRALRHRVAVADDTLAADRWPIANILSIVLPLGIVIAVAGLLVNLTWGWESQSRALVQGTSVVLHGDTSLALAEEQALPLPGITEAFPAALQPQGIQVMLPLDRPVNAGGVSLHLRQITPGYRVSATRSDGSLLPIRASNFVSPTNEVLVALSEQEPERFLAVPDARLALAIGLSGQQESPGKVRVFELPSGKIISETLVRPEIVINDTRFNFAPARGAVIDASYRPGDLLVWMGLALAVVGFIGALIYPARRIVVQHHGHWTEFYATGRGARRVLGDVTAKNTKRTDEMERMIETKD